MVLGGDPRAVLRRGRGDPARRHRLHHRAGQRLLADTRRQLRARRLERVLGDTERTPQHGDLVRRLDPPGGAKRGLGVDQFGVGERHRQQLRECRCQRVGSDPPGGGRTGQLLEHLDQRHRVPRQPVEMVVADLVGDALVPRAVQVDLTGRADHLADRAERPGARDPQLRRPGHVPDVGLPAEDQDVDVVGRHLGQHPLAPAAAQSLWRQAGSRVPSGPPVGGVGVVGDATW